LVIASAINSISTRESLSRKRGSSVSGAPFFDCAAANAFRRSSSRFDVPMRAVFMRSWPSRYLATVQPLPSSNTRFSDRHLHVVEEHLVHLVAAVHEDQRAAR
jgi:hypothetical protein